MDPQTACTRCNELRKQYSATRRYMDAFWTLQIAYAAGEQWGFLAEKQGNIAVKRLPVVMESDRANGRVRITIDSIGDFIDKGVSLTNPQQIDATVMGPGNSTDSYTRNATKVLYALLKRIGALTHLRQANPDRHTVGSAGIRQVIRQVGPKHLIRQAQGRREAVHLGQYEIEWANVQPWEIIRSPAAKSQYMARDEDEIGHEKPRSAVWFKQYWGLDLNTQTQMGQMVHFLDEIRHLQGGPGHGTLMTDAKQPAALACEYWLTDPDKSAEIYAETGLQVRWPWTFYGYIDPAKGANEIRPVPNIGENGLLANPFSGLPLSWYWYKMHTEAMWGTGLTWRLMQWQDFQNSAYTWLSETLRQCSQKWLYEDNTLEKGKESYLINPDPWKPIPWKRFGQFSTPPQRTPPAQIPQAAMEVIGLAPSGMERQAGIAPVQMGIGPKRDGSGRALETLAANAGSLPEDRITSDEIDLAELLKQTVVDAISLMTLDQLGQLTGGRVSESFLKELKRDDPRNRIAAVQVHPSTMRPQTRMQTEGRLIGLVRSMVLQPDAALKEATRAGVTGIDTDRENSYAKQKAEIELMRAGRYVGPIAHDKHTWHIECLGEVLDSPEALDFAPELLDMLLRHVAEHQFALEQTMGMALGQPDPRFTNAPVPNGQGSPPAAPSQFQRTGAIGPAGPRVSAA